MAKDLLAPELMPERTAVELREWLAVDAGVEVAGRGGAALYRATALRWASALPGPARHMGRAEADVVAFKGVGERMALYQALAPLADGVTHDSWGERKDDAALRWLAAHDDVAAARAARKSKEPGSRGAVAAALTRLAELQPLALAQYEQVRQDVNRQLAAIHQRALVESTQSPSPAPPARFQVAFH